MLLKKYYRPTQNSVSPFWRIRDDWDHLFGANPLNALIPNKTEWSPSLDVVEEKNTYLVKLEIPGVQKDDVSVTFEDGVLTVAGERKQEKSTEESRVHLSERYYGKFERAVRFPTLVDPENIAAKFNAGILEITLPKTEEAKPKQIHIKAD